jgi:cation diffusion facilitator family transporter
MPRLDWGIGALTLAVAVNGIVSTRLMRVAREHGSQALQAEAIHLRSDLLSCVGVLVGLAGVAITGNPRLDPAVAAVMTFFVIASAVSLLRDSLRPLLDESLPPEEEQRVLAALREDPRVLGFHKLRTRRSGSHRHVDVHVLLDDELSFSEAHRITEEVEGKIRAVLPNTDIIVHAEPYAEETRHQQERHGQAG